MRRSGLAALVAASALLPQLYAPPPLITGDVPVAGPGHFELYTGFRYQDTGAIQRQLPHIEFVYGVADRWEVSAEANYLSRAGEHGFDDLTVAAKTVLVAERPTRPGLGASYEFKFANGESARGLGSGGNEHDLRLRAQKTVGAHTPILNFGYVLVPDVSINGRRSARQDVWRASLADEWAVADRTKLLTEAYWRTADDPGGAARLGWNVGFKHEVHDDLSLHAAVGESLRSGNRGGPDLRVYFGIKYEFAARRARVGPTRARAVPRAHSRRHSIAAYCRDVIGA